MRANTVPTLLDGFKPFAAFVGSKGVNSPSGRSCRLLPTKPSEAITGVRVRRVSSAALMAGQTLTTAGLTERGCANKPGRCGNTVRPRPYRGGVRLDERVKPRSVSPAEDTA